MIHPKRIEEIKASRQLPSPTGVVMKLLRLAENEENLAEEITQIIQSDPALAGRVLKYANSAYVGATRPVVSVVDAVLRVGSRGARRLALGFALLAQFRQGGCKRFVHAEYWSRSLAVAIASQMLSRATRNGNSDEVFVCGLLSDIGCLALATMHPDAYDEVLGQADGKSTGELLRLERQAFAMDHVDLTIAILEDWGLPPEYAQAVSGQTQADSVESTPATDTLTLPLLLCAARAIARYCKASDKDRAGIAGDLLALGGRLGIDSTTLSLLADQAAQEWRHWCEIMEVPSTQVPSLLRLSQHGAAPKGQGATADDCGNLALRVLVADDDPVCLAMLVRDVQQCGHEVTTATNGQQALHVALESWPQVIITDLQMPQMGGLEFCRLLRQTRLGQQTYVIMLTGCDQDLTVVQALDAGADDYCVKPYNPRVLAARLRAGQRAIGLQRALEHEREEARQTAARLAVVNRQLEQSAYTDVLTGLPNRAYARETLLSAWTQAFRDRLSLVCMMIDIDHFKRVNDTFGHDIGDLVLQKTAAALRGGVRGSDVVCRLGGEEFLLICKGTSLADGQMVAERLRRAVAANVVKAPGFSGVVTVSIGVAGLSLSMSHPDELLKEADRALYAAKHGGRNCVRAAASDGDPNLKSLTRVANGNAP